MYVFRPGAVCARVLFCLLAGSASAQEFKIIGPAGYCDATVLHGPNARGASSAAPQGRSMILWDPEVMATLPYLRAFALAHECGHHALDHTSPAGLLREGHNFRTKELDADCWAARALVKSGETAVLIRQIALWSEQTSLGSDPRYPSWSDRIETLKRCGDG